MPRLTESIPILAGTVLCSAILAFPVLADFAAGPNEVGEGPVRTASSGRGDPWRLRPSDVVMTSSIPAPAPKGGVPMEAPDERRVIRVVYPGLTGTR